MSADLDTPVSVLEGLKEAVGDKAEIKYARGSNLTYDEELEKELLIGEKVFHVMGVRIMNCSKKLWILPSKRILLLQ